MKKNLLLLLFIFIAGIANAQKQPTQQPAKEKMYKVEFSRSQWQFIIEVIGQSDIPMNKGVPIANALTAQILAQDTVPTPSAKEEKKK